MQHSISRRVPKDGEALLLHSDYQPRLNCVNRIVVPALSLERIIAWPCVEQFWCAASVSTQFGVQIADIDISCSGWTANNATSSHISSGRSDAFPTLVTSAVTASLRCDVVVVNAIQCDEECASRFAERSGSERLR